LEVRTRIKGQGYAYVKQCTFCGRQRGGDIARATVPYTPPPYETDREEIFERKYRQLTRSLSDATRVPFGETVTPSSILERRLDALLEEFKKEEHGVAVEPLVASYFRRQRDRHTQGFKSAWASEKEISKWFIRKFSKWFHIQEEVEGQGYVNNEKCNIRIDFVIQAKEQLLNAGFTDQPIGIEVKYFDPRSDNNFHSKSSRGVFQALSYSYSGARWNLETTIEPAPLASVLLLSNLSFKADRDYMFRTCDEYFKTLWGAYLKLANHGNVGELQIEGNANSAHCWRFYYSGASYFTIYGDGTLKKGNPNLINKSRIGNTT
jgi:hypothetical protein